MKKPLIFALFLCSFSFMLTPVYAQDTEAVKSRIEEINKKMIQDMLNQNYANMDSYYTDDVISMPSYEAAIRGKNNLMEKAKNDQGQMKMTEFQLNTTEVFGSGQYYIEVGEYDVTLEMKGRQEPIKDNGKYMTVWEDTGGQLKVKAEIWNTNTNPWEQMAAEQK